MQWNRAALGAQQGQTPATGCSNSHSREPVNIYGPWLPISFWENVRLHSSLWTFTGRIRNGYVVWGGRRGMRWEDVEALRSSEAAASPLLSYAGPDSRQWLQQEDGDKVGHFTIAIVFELEHLSLAIHRRYLPQGPTYINQSDKRDALTAFLSLRLPVAIKELLLTHISNGCYCEDWLS